MKLKIRLHPIFFKRALRCALVHTMSQSQWEALNQEIGNRSG